MFGAFIRWKSMVKNTANLKVKCLQSNNVGEHVNDDFKKYCDDNGIKM